MFSTISAIYVGIGLCIAVYARSQEPLGPQGWFNIIAGWPYVMTIYFINTRL